MMVKEIEFNAEDILGQVRPTPVVQNQLSEAEKIAKISENFRSIMETLGLDLENDSLRESPERMGRMYVEEVFSGLNPANFPKITVIENEMDYDQMVSVKKIKVMSKCEHHFVPFHGFATVAYIPKKRVIGLSKINRIVDYFARRPQVQERLTKQIADCLCYILDTENVGVFVEAQHFCVVSRGVQDINSSTATSDLRGVFRSNVETRGEFLRHCQ